MLIIGSILLLLANAVTLRREKSILFNRVAILILLYSGLLVYDSLAIGSLDRGIGVFSGLFHSTAITHSFYIFIYIIGAVILQLTSFYPRRLRTAQLTLQKSQLVNKNEEQFLIIEYPLVILFILIGATFLMSSSDLVSMFLAIELQSYGLYILATLYRNSELSTTAGLTYFLLGGLSSCFILLGSSLLYLNSGLTNLDGIYVLASLCDENKGALPSPIKRYLFKVSATLSYSQLVFTPSLRNSAFQSYRAYSTKTSTLSQLNPNFITGFTDGEGCFYIQFCKDSRMKLG